MEEDNILEGFLALIAFSIFFLFARIGIILTSTNPDSYLYIEYNPPEDWKGIFYDYKYSRVILFHFLTFTK